MLALTRLILERSSKLTNFSAFLTHDPLLPAQLPVGVEKVLLDLAAQMEDGALDDPRQALNLIIFEDFFSPK